MKHLAFSLMAVLLSIGTVGCVEVDYDEPKAKVEPTGPVDDPAVTCNDGDSSKNGSGTPDGWSINPTCANPNDVGQNDQNQRVIDDFGDFVTETLSDEIKLMSFNVENLFDNEHDVVNGIDKEDYYYLPKGHPEKHCDRLSSRYVQSCLDSDWHSGKLEEKLNRLAKVINDQGSLPDVIGLQEVENANVLGMLAARLGYSTRNLIITKGPDVRGIEVGFLYKTDKLRLVSHKEHVVEVKDTRPTRNVLEAIFELKQKPGEYLMVVVNHWPSQGTPMSGWKRTNGAIAMMEAVAVAKRNYGEKLHVVGLGDFNTLNTDRPHPFVETVLDQSLSHALVNDIQWQYEESTRCKGEPGRSHSSMPQGTYFYRRNAEWNKFDRFFPSKNLVDGEGVEILVNSFRVVTSRYSSDVVELAYQYARPGQIVIPNRFDYDAQNDLEKGAADHFPVTVKLMVR